MLKIVYACNDEWFDGLYLSILSIVRRTKEPIHFYLLTADCTDLNPKFHKLSDKNELAIRNMINKYASDKSTDFTVLDCGGYYKKYIKTSVNVNTKFSPYAMFRLFLDKFSAFDGRVLYLDIDTMALGDVKEFLNVNLKDNEFAASHNYYGAWRFKKDYFNSGVILFNMPVVKKNNFLEKARDIMINIKHKWPDQNALYRASTKYVFFPDNEFRYNWQQIKIGENAIIKHFSANSRFYHKTHLFYSNVKQWEIDEVHDHYHIYDFDQDYEIYKDMKNGKNSENINKRFISVKNLKKSYGEIKAVDNISFTVKKGSLFAFLGVNGAGKSTTINIISSILSKDSGEVKIDGYDLIKDNGKVKEEIGIVFQNSSLDNLLTVKENLIIRARFYKMSKKKLTASIDRVTKTLNLEPILNQPVGKLSGGQKRRVDIARALVHEPKLLMLDEPTTGLDPKTRIAVWRLIDEIRQRTNMTVFLTTHYLEEADKASYVVIMNKGKIIAEGTPNELKNRYSTDTLISYQKKNDAFEKNVKGYKYRYDNDAGAYRIAIKDSDDAKKLLNKYSKFIKDFEVEKGSMDSVFLKVTGGAK